MDEFVYYGNLFEIYKDKGILTGNAISIYALYYEENLSMSEIAEIKNVSKSYVGSVINNTTKKLENLEKYFGLFRMKDKLNRIIKLDDIDEIKKELMEVLQ